MCCRARTRSPKTDKPNISLSPALALITRTPSTFEDSTFSSKTFVSEGSGAFCGKIHLLDGRAPGLQHRESIQGQLWHQPPPSPNSFGVQGMLLHHLKESPCDLLLLPPPFPPLPLQILISSFYLLLSPHSPCKFERRECLEMLLLSLFSQRFGAALGRRD